MFDFHWEFVLRSHFVWQYVWLIITTMFNSTEINMFRWNHEGGPVVTQRCSRHVPDTPSTNTPSTNTLSTNTLNVTDPSNINELSNRLKEKRTVLVRLVHELKSCCSCLCCIHEGLGSGSGAINTSHIKMVWDTRPQSDLWSAHQSSCSLNVTVNASRGSWFEVKLWSFSSWSQISNQCTRISSSAHQQSDGLQDQTGQTADIYSSEHRYGSGQKYPPPLPDPQHFDWQAPCGT